MKPNEPAEAEKHGFGAWCHRFRSVGLCQFGVCGVAKTRRETRVWSLLSTAECHQQSVHISYVFITFS